MFLQNNSFQTNYLSKYDLINKYSLTTIYNSPKIDSITLEFSLTNLLKAYDFNKLSVNDKEIQIKAFLFFYLFNGSFPFLNSKKASTIKTSEKSQELNLALKIKISNQNLINQFLFLFFIENWNRFLKEDMNLFNNQIINNNSKVLNFNIKCPGSVFFEMDHFLNTTLININSKEFFISLNFLIKNSKQLTSINTNNLIKNLPLFWING